MKTLVLQAIRDLYCRNKAVTPQDRYFLQHVTELKQTSLKVANIMKFNHRL